MAETTAPPTTRRRRGISLLGPAIVWACVAGLALIVAAELVFFAVHAAQVLRYPYPLDYGEGPLLAQVGLLRAGLPIWRLYGDPGAPPYAVVNYPPVYHLLAALAALVVGDTLLAGRLVALAATLAALAALAALIADRRPPTADRQPNKLSSGDSPPSLLHSQFSILNSRLIVLAFLGLPIVREWAVLMRVDMLGVCLGLWGLALVWRGRGWRLLWAAPLFVLSLLVKPSLLAAPAAALVWLAFRDCRRALLLGLLTAALGGLALGLLQLASGGWFAIHVLAANANVWQRTLAHGFWHDQLAILWPLLAPAALLALSVIAAGPTTEKEQRTENKHRSDSAITSHRRPGSQFSILNSQFSILPLYYTLFGALVAFGVGKVGAYANYFLELYAGLIWIAAAAIQPLDRRSKIEDRRSSRAILDLRSSIFNRWLSVLASLCVAGALLRYYPLWSETYLKPYGLIEKANPPRVAFGRYGVWRDLAREREALAALGRINAALVAEVRAAGAPIFTDVPGLAAQAGQLARLQAFEHRQLLDAGRWDQRPLLRDMANGRVPLVVLDYLGNWLTPEMIALITHRYAQEGSRGAYDIYRPVELGAPAAADLRFPGGPWLVGYRLALSAGQPIYQPGEIVLLTLEWRRDQNAADAYDVVARLADGRGNVLLETARPLLYGALPPRDWANETVQHLQPIALPPELPAGDYQLLVALRAGGRELAPPRAIAPILVEQRGGRLLGERGYFVPEPLLSAWRAAGGYDGPGDPLMPATPFHGYTLQCFARACLRLEGDTITRIPLGELIHLGDAGLRAAPPAAGTQQRFAETGQSLRGAFLDYWRASGGLEALGPPITGELLRGDQIVQYTRYARLERPIDGGEVRLGRLGDEFLRLPGGGPYRWP